MNKHPEMPNDLKLLQLIGEGGMSYVWQAMDLLRGTIVAVKILKAELTRNPDDLAKFKAEEKMMEQINHSGVVRSFELRQYQDRWFYVMEYVDGYNFAQLLERKRHLPEVDCLLICESVAAALDYAWRINKVVHCDLKPENIMINSEGIIKLTDLGLGHTFNFRNRGLQDVPEQIMGTPGYISPEQVYGDREPDCRTDIYSLGATLYHLATGRLLFAGADSETMMRSHCDENTQAYDPRFFRPSLSESFCRLLERMLVKDRDYRIDSWRKVYDCCLQIENGADLPPRENPAAHSSIKLG